MELLVRIGNKSPLKCKIEGKEKHQTFHGLKLLSHLVDAHIQAICRKLLLSLFLELVP